MSAGTAKLVRLQRTSPLGARWGSFLSWAGPHLDQQADPWLLYPFGLLGSGALPTAGGPVVYAAVALDGQCRYVGQSVDVQDRFRGHESDTGKRQRWNYVLVATLRPDITHHVLGNAETTARRLCRPAEGTRSPRLR